MYFLREEKSREVKGGARVSERKAKYLLIRLAFTRTSLGRGYKCQSGLGHRPPSSETCNSRSFVRHVSNIGSSRAISNACLKFGRRLQSLRPPPLAFVLRCISMSAPRPALST